MANEIRAVIEMKNNIYKEYIRLGMRHNYYVRLENLTTELSNLIINTKTEYHRKLATKLVNPSTSAKTYWSILKTFANGRNVPVIPPLLINNEFVSNFKTKSNYFNKFFNQQCTEISTDRSIPSSVNLATNETVTNINFSEQLISKLIVAVNPNKAHGNDGLSSRILQISKPFKSLKPVTSRQHGRRLMLLLSTKKETSEFWVIIDLFSFYLLVANCLKKSFLIQLFNTWW